MESATTCNKEILEKNSYITTEHSFNCKKMTKPSQYITYKSNALLLEPSCLMWMNVKLECKATENSKCEAGV
jgi:hypothetical protein